MAVLAEGQAPERIDWWFCDPGSPLLPLSPFGSNNWSKPHTQVGGVGEVVGAPRPWRNGSKPAGACGGGNLHPVACFPNPLPDLLYATLTMGSQSLTIPISYVPNSAPDLWSGQGAGIGTCQIYRVELRCEEVFVGNQIGFQWDLRLFGGDGSQNDALDSVAIIGPTLPPLRLALAVVNVLASCTPAGTTGGSLVVTDVQPRGLSLI